MHWRDLISLHGVFVVAGLMTYVLASHTMRQRRQPAAAIAWVITLALVPYVGLPLYLVFGTRKLARPKRVIPHLESVPGANADDAWPQRLAAGMKLVPDVEVRDLRTHYV